MSKPLVKFTVTVPEADTVSLTLGENDTYVLLDGSKLAAAVKTAAKTTPSTFTFESPANGTLYTSAPCPAPRWGTRL